MLLMFHRGKTNWNPLLDFSVPMPPPEILNDTNEGDIFYFTTKCKSRPLIVSFMENHLISEKEKKLDYITKWIL